MKVVILAGGKGTRLLPYTTVFPKPLMPIGDQPILELVIKQLKSYNLTDIILAVGHLKELVMAFFSDGTKLGVRITYSVDDKPLGTAGPLGSLRNELQDTFLVMNGDVLTTLNFNKIIESHRKSGAIATIALTKRKVKIDYGVPELDEERNIIGFSEKPEISYFVSMGIYLFEPKILDYIADNQYIDFPDLLKKLIESNETVKGYVCDDYWLDIGRVEDYARANDELKTIYSQLFNT
jgi:NDP-mannose synthase